MAYPEQANMKGWSSEPSIYHHPSNLYSTLIPTPTLRGGGGNIAPPGVTSFQFEMSEL